MILSFSVPEMRPMIEAGLRQLRGETVDERVKRQTIRARGPRAAKLLSYDPICHSIRYDLQLWWKSRTAERALIGVVPVDAVRVYPIEILHSSMQFPGKPFEQCLRITGPRDWNPGNDAMFWTPGDGDNAFNRFARADGFDSVEAFRNFFVPEPRDRFSGILYRW